MLKLTVKLVKRTMKAAVQCSIHTGECTIKLPTMKGELEIGARQERVGHLDCCIMHFVLDGKKCTEEELHAMARQPHQSNKG